MIRNTIAVIGDIHGNVLALREVLSDIQHRGIETILNLGDSLYGPLDPVGTFKLIREHGVISISGNQDRLILESLERRSDNETLEYVKSQLTPEMIHWISGLPFERIFENEIYCCHGTPESDSKYLLEKIREGEVVEREENEIEQELKEVRQKVVLCGHSHKPHVKQFSDRMILNPGSVGLPAYDDDDPVYYKMESGNPEAKYLILSPGDDFPRIEPVSIAYDFDAAAVLAEKNNRPDWAGWLRNGKA